ncbi:putative serine/threonine-protein kinase Mps1 [Plasmopara halstedii]
MLLVDVYRVFDDWFNQKDDLQVGHRQQEEADESYVQSTVHITSLSVSPIFRHHPRSSEGVAEAVLAPPAQTASSYLQGREEQDAKHRMKHVYEKVLRRKNRAEAGTAAPRGSSETDSSVSPMMSNALIASDNVELRCIQQPGVVQCDEIQRNQESALHSYFSLSPKREDRRRTRSGLKRVSFVTPPLAVVSGSSSSAGTRHADLFSAEDYRRDDDRNARRRERLERRQRRQENTRGRSTSNDGKGSTLLDVDDATVRYIDAVLVRPDQQVFNKYTRYFLDLKLETLYQDFTAIFWFRRARWHVALWMSVHLFVNLIFYVLPGSKFTGMKQFILSYSSLPTFLQWVYILIALPFAALPNKSNPFQTRWRSWVCLIIILFNLTFQIWLADASRLATSSYLTIVHDHLTCDASNSELTLAFAGLKMNSNEEALSNITVDFALAYLRDEQMNLAISVTHISSDALVQTLITFESLFSFLFVISIRLEFVQVVVVAVTAATTYAIVVTAFGFQLQWLMTFSYGTAVVLFLILSYSTDRTNRRSFLSNFLVEKENESLKSSLKQAEAALQNDTARADEERAVARVLAAPEMQHLEMVHIPFADLTFLQAIGRGSMGDVIKARYFGTVVVCKRMRREHIVETNNGRNRHGQRDAWNEDSALASFRDEIELMSCLRHPNIVQFIGASWDNASNLCIVMEYLENGDMHSVLHSGLGKNFTWADPLLKMAVDAVQGMLYLHSQERPVVHRDLKSVNILCSATYGCKVGDFGLSRRYKKGVDALTTLVGTPFWLAPEIIRSERYGPEADVYSFGIVLTELETRRTPYHDQEETGLKVLMRVAHKGLRPSLPSTCHPERRKLIEACLHDVPRHRPTFLQVLSRLQGPVRLEIEGQAAAQPELERRVLLRRCQERQSL